MSFLRFVLHHSHPDSGLPEGVFRAAYRLRDHAELAVQTREELAGVLAWFDKHLAVPKRFNRSRSKGYYRRKSRGIAWLRDTACEHIGKMHALARILQASGCLVTILVEAHPGYIVYEDEYQVIAEPFADTAIR